MNKKFRIYFTTKSSNMKITVGGVNQGRNIFDKVSGDNYFFWVKLVVDLERHKFIFYIEDIK